MLTDKELEKLTEYIVMLYRRLETELLLSVASRFDTYDKVGGTLEWQLKKLQEMGSLNKEAVDLIAKYANRSREDIIEMMNDAGFSNIDKPVIDKAFAAGTSAVTAETLMQSPHLRSTIESSYKELRSTYKLIETKALESTKQAYMDVINKSYIATASGIYDYNTAIKKALAEMADKGITGATYKRGDRIINYSLEGTVRRDTITAVHKIANKVSEEACAELGADYVEISEHMGARVSVKSEIANHAGWQGKVFKLEGFDEKYGNLREHTGYPDDIEGLGGVNCRHRMYPFFPGISVERKHHIDPAESERPYKLSQKQRALEREVRRCKREELVAKTAGDAEAAKEWKKKVSEAQDKIIGFCEDNNLTRQPEREMITEDY